LIKQYGETKEMREEQLAGAFFTLMQARNVCSKDGERAGLVVYEIAIPGEFSAAKK
jgi:hypothetical protein